MQVRNLSILVTCQLISATGSIVMVTLGGIIGSTLATNKAFATLPLSMMVVAIAATTVPATMLMRKIGRRKGFAISSICAAVAVMVAVLAIQHSSFALFTLSTMLFGVNMGFTQQYRYAAAESVAPRYVPRAVSFVLLGIGWNFLYVGGTTLLTYTYSMAERFRAQAVNEFLVFGTSATASLLAGTIMYFFGWGTLMLVPIPILVAICAALLLVRKDPLLNRAAIENRG